MSKRRKLALNNVTVFLSVFLSIIVVLGVVFEAPASSPLSQTTAPVLTWLHVDGHDIKNELNETIYLRGAAFGGMGESGLAYWNGGKDQLVDMMAAYVNLSGHTADSNKANVIRVCTGIIPGYGWDPSVMDAAVDDIVSLARANGIYIVVEFHGGLTENESTQLANNPSPLINWFLHWVNRYKDNPAVCGFEIYNEPYAPNFADGDSTLGQARWVEMVQQMVANITAANSKALIFVSSAFPGFNQVGDYWIENPLQGNVVYTWDWYYKDFPSQVKQAYEDGQFEYAKNLMNKAIYDAAGKAVVEGNLPVLNSEFGFSPGEYSDPQIMDDYLEAMNQYENSWYEFWWWSNPNQQGLVMNNYTQLSAQGVSWAKYLWQGNPGNFTFVNSFVTPTPTPTPSPTPTPTLAPTPSESPSPSPTSTYPTVSSPTPTPVISVSPSLSPTISPSLSPTSIITAPTSTSSPSSSSSPSQEPISSPEHNTALSLSLAYGIVAGAAIVVVFAVITRKDYRQLLAKILSRLKRKNS